MHTGNFSLRIEQPVFVSLFGILKLTNAYTYFFLKRNNFFVLTNVAYSTNEYDTVKGKQLLSKPFKDIIID